MKNKSSIVVPIVSVLVALFLGAFLVLIVGSNPMDLFSSLFKASFLDVNAWLQKSSILIMTGLAIAFAYKCGLFNIGAEGQFVFSSIFVAFFAVNVDMPDTLVPIVSLALGFILGALWALIPGLLRAFYNISEVVVTIMMNWIALYITDFFIQTYFHTQNNIAQTEFLSNDRLIEVTLFGNTLNYAILISLIMVFIYFVILEKTTFGYEIKAIGHSKKVSEYIGISDKKRIVQTMLISGGFAGMAGAIYSLSIPAQEILGGVFRNFGFDGISVALLGGLNSIGIVISALLMGSLRNANSLFSLASIPKEISDVIIGLIILFSMIGPIVYNKIKDKRSK